MTQSEVRGKIIVVDDNARAQSVLQRILSREGHEVRGFESAKAGIEAARLEPPDLFVLDIDMPEMDGFEACRVLKADPQLGDIPVMFISGLDSAQDVVTGLEAGGVDYIAKPFHAAEIRARVVTHLRLHFLTERLEQVVEERTRELAAANQRLERLDHSKNDFLRRISHEMRTPLNGVFAVGQLALDQLPEGVEKIELTQLFDISQRRLGTLIDDALTLTTLELSPERFPASPTAVPGLLSRAAELAGKLPHQCELVRLDAPEDLEAVAVSGHPELLAKGLAALIQTSAELAERRGDIHLAAERDADWLLVTLRSTGRQVAESTLRDFGEVISQPLGGDIDEGLRTPLAAKIFELYGGELALANLSEPDGVLLSTRLHIV